MLLVIDGNSILNRAFYGVRPLTNADGKRTEALFGMLHMVLPLLERYSPDHAAVAFDLHAPTFRHKLYDAYKAGRHPTPPELITQIEEAKPLLRAFGLAVFEREGYEADDYLGSLAAAAEREGIDTVLFTGDRDSLQLISEKTKVLLAKNKENVLYDRALFKETYGVWPEQYLDCKALMGDSSDNIPGVPGIGEKSAFELIAAYGSMDALYAAIDEGRDDLKPARREKLIAGRDLAVLSRRLAEISRDAPFAGLDAARRAPMDGDAVTRLLTDYGFFSILSSLSFPTAAAGTLPHMEYRSDLLPPGGRDGHYALSLHGEELYLFDPANEVGQILQKNDALDAFISENFFTVFDGKTLCAALPALEDRVEYDCMLAAWVLQPDQPCDKPGAMGRMVMQYLQAAGEEDTILTMPHLWWMLREKTEAALRESGQWALYETIELPLSMTLGRMERTGAPVDRAGLRAFGDRLAAVAADWEEKIHAFAGHSFNINSPKQLGTVLFEELRIPGGKKTKSGYSTSADELEKLAPYHPIIPAIFEYRQAVKLRSTYAIALDECADAESRVHTCYRQTGTATGRLSSAEPNLQNIPIRTPLGRELRKYFVAGEGKVFVDADYSQIELRVLAALSGDTAMTDAFLSGEDIHRLTASQVFDLPPEEVTPALRSRAKAVNFGIVYGISDFSLAGDIGVSKKEAGAYIAAYKRRFSGISAYLDGTVEKAKELGFVVSAFGRRRYIPELRSGKAMLRAFGERVARNSPIQGTAADIIKLAMLRVERRLRAEGLAAKLILQIHDELIVEAPEAEADAVAAILRAEMEAAWVQTVPFTAEVSIGKTWYDCKG